MGKDTLFSEPIEKLGDWFFDGKVADVFPDMLARSIPGYANIIAMIGMVAGRFAKQNSHLYDLGCSLGAAALAMQRNIKQSGCQIIAVDNSPAMIERCKRHIIAVNGSTPIDIQCADICDVVIENASMIVLNFTLQFVSPDERQTLLNRIYQSLNPNGMLILSEKLDFSDSTINEFLSKMHYDFKRVNGYSELEITQKRSMLENIMITDTLYDHKHRLRTAGFMHIETWFQCFNFCSLIAIK